MATLHASLRSKLARLRSASIRFSTEQQCFVLGDVRKRGLTKSLAELVPVPRVRRTTADEASERVPCTVEHFAGATLQRCGRCDDAVRWHRTTDTPLGRRLRDERNIDRAHGLVIDYQVALYVRAGRKALFAACRVVDPCVGTLLEHLAALGWCAVASQVPIYDTVSDCATAIDVLATDRDTRRQLMLIELKAIRGRRDDGHYECERGTVRRGALRDMPQSYYARHQLQLLWMHDAVQRQFGFRFDHSLVMRISPGTVRSYPLAFATRAADLVQALATPKKKRQRNGARPAPYKRRKVNTLSSF